MRFHVLGPLEVLGDGGDPLTIAGSKERTVLANLIARAGVVVSFDDLIDELWGDNPPRTAEKTLGSYVSRLRKTLERGRAPDLVGDVIATLGGGYVLAPNGHDIDAIRFEELAKDGRDLLDEGREEAAAGVLDEALSLWRGAAYQGLRYTNFGASEGERLQEIRRSAIEDRIDADLATGSDTTLVAQLEGVVREEPLRERRWAQLMLALYRAGRQAEALEAYRRAREGLVNELGIEPGPALQEVQAAILGHDPLLDAGARPAGGRPKRTDVCPY